MKIINDIRISEAQRPRLTKPCAHCGIQMRNLKYCSHFCARLARVEK